MNDWPIEPPAHKANCKEMLSLYRQDVPRKIILECRSSSRRDDCIGVQLVTILSDPDGDPVLHVLLGSNREQREKTQRVAFPKNVLSPKN